MNELKLKVPNEPKLDGFKIWNQLDDFVDNHFDELWDGACRLQKQDFYENVSDVNEIEPTYWAPRRISILHENGFNETRLHREQLIKYFNGIKYDTEIPPNEDDVKQVVNDLQMLLDAYGKDQDLNIELKIVNK